MPWESKTVEEIRKEFVEAAETATNFSSLCREFGITRRTGYKWIDRSKETDNLSDRSHARKNINNKTNLETEKLILALRTENPGWKDIPHTPDFLRGNSTARLSHSWIPRHYEFPC